MQAIILAAGKGTRMVSSLPKVLHPAQGSPLLEHVLDTLVAAGVKSPRVIVGHGADKVRSFLNEYEKRTKCRSVAIEQKVQNGTGHAVMMTKASFKSVNDHVLIWPGDMPMLELKTLKSFIRKHRQKKSIASVLSSIQENPTGYGRILREKNRFIGIREEVDASASEKQIKEVNSGVYLFQRKTLFEALSKIKPTNQKKELYLTDVIEILNAKGIQTFAFPLATPEEGLGVNNRRHLADVNRILNERNVGRLMDKGVTIVSPEQTYIEKNVRVGNDSLIQPFCYIESGVRIGKNCQIGPFAKIRKGTRVEDNVIVGSFVEVARSSLKKGAMAKHLSYLGDAVVGERVNIGAGTITANFNGIEKNKTVIGSDSLIGSNTVLVAPAKLGKKVKTGAGAVVKSRSVIRSGEVVAGVPARLIKKGRKK